MPAPPEGHGKSHKPPSIFPCPDYVHWEQDLREYWADREAYYRNEGLPPEESRRAACERVREIHAARVAARHQARAAMTPEETARERERRQAERDAVETTFRETAARIWGSKGRVQR